jgi:hypothetical protein
MELRKVECNNHGLSVATFVCQHLTKIDKVGFNEAFASDPNNLEEFQAWCDECEKIRVIENGWNDKSERFAKIELLCHKCYFEIKKLNGL